MKPHDYDALNDAQCLHVDLFAERLERCRVQNLGEATAFRVARAAAQKRFPLEPGEAVGMDEYISTRFGRPKPTGREPEGLLVPTLVVI